MHTSSPPTAAAIGALLLATALALALAGCAHTPPTEPAAPTATTTDAEAPWWSALAATSLTRAGTNAPELLSALEQVPPDQRRGMEFLIEHMPPGDLASLDAAFLLENVRLAYEARDTAPWGDALPDDVFLNDVLPYAHVSETRERWRADFRDRFQPLIADCQTPAEAAQRLNQHVFGDLGVKYSTKRKKPDQSPGESAEIGMASCTGLSIILADACRAVGVPARLVGTPSWATKRGNHTWVEVWDGTWHFTGAAEPDKRGLDHAWFEGDAAHATSDPPEHGIYAVSYAPTGSVFPMVWAEDADPVSGVDVTARYAKQTEAPSDTIRLYVRVIDGEGGERVAATVIVVGTDPETGDGFAGSGASRGPRADANDLLAFDVPPGLIWRIEATVKGRSAVVSYGPLILPSGDEDSTAEPAIVVVTLPR